MRKPRIRYHEGKWWLFVRLNEWQSGYAIWNSIAEALADAHTPHKVIRLYSIKEVDDWWAQK